MARDSPRPWRVVGTRTLLADRWIRLRADECENDAGLAIAPYYVLEYGDWISVLALSSNDEAIVVDEYRHGAGVIALGTIGGAVEPGEQPIAAARRELREETGFEASEIVDLGPTWANFGNHTNRVHHFLARGCERVGDPQLDESEAIAVHVMPMDGLDEHLHQSYHQLTWYKGREWLSARSGQ